MEPKLTTYSDQTGRFPHRLSRGNKYVMIMQDYDANAILSPPFKNGKAKSITEAWMHLHKKLTKHGHETKTWTMSEAMTSNWH